MGYIGRRIGKSQDSGDSNPAGADGAVGGGILDLFSNGYFERQGGIFNAPGAGDVAAQASGGVVAEYSSGADIYKAHTFNTSGSFVVTSPGTEYLQDLMFLSSVVVEEEVLLMMVTLVVAVEVVLFSIFLDKVLVLEHILL